MGPHAVLPLLLLAAAATAAGGEPSLAAAFVEDGEDTRLEYRYAAAGDYGLCLMRVVYADGNGGTLTHQRFEESTGPDADGNVRVPPPPAGFRFERVVFERLVVDREAVREDYEAGWYRQTWNHFTTAVKNRDGWQWLLVADRVPVDLEEWCRSSGIPVLDHHRFVAPDGTDGTGDR